MFLLQDLYSHKCTIKFNFCAAIYENPCVLRLTSYALNYKLVVAIYVTRIDLSLYTPNGLLRN
jgi:hypothetical protein